MSLPLSGKSERIEPYHHFGLGRVIDLMPELIKAGYQPAGIAIIAERREHAPEDVKGNWDNYFWTGDSGVTDYHGGVLLTLDSPLLRLLTPKSQLVNRALQLTRRQEQELKADKDHSLYLSPQEVEDAHGKGYILQNGVFVPANKAVAKAWDHLMRGRNIQSYAQLVSDASRSNNILRLYFDRSKPETPSLRSLVVLRPGGNSDVDGDYYLNNSDAGLAGVAPEAHVAREKSVSPNVVQPTLEQTLAVINNPDLDKNGMIKAVSQLYKR